MDQLLQLTPKYICLSVILLAANDPRSNVVHLKRRHVSFNQSVVCSTNHNPALRTCASLHGLSTPANCVDMSLGAFVPTALRQVHRRHNLFFFFGRYWREKTVGMPAKKNRNNCHLKVDSKQLVGCFPGQGPVSRKTR